MPLAGQKTSEVLSWKTGLEWSFQLRRLVSIPGFCYKEVAGYQLGCPSALNTIPIHPSPKDYSHEQCSIFSTPRQFL